MDKPTSEYLRVESLPAFGNVVHGAEMDAADGIFHSGQFHNLEAVACRSRVGVAGDYLQAVLNRLVQRDRRLQSSTLIADDPGNSVKGRAHDTCDLRLVCYDSTAGGEPDSGQGLLNDLDLGHVVLFLDEVEPPLTELAQCNDPMQTLKLGRIVGSVAAEPVHVCWHEQACGIPMPQHPMGHLPDLRESSDG